MKFNLSKGFHQEMENIALNIKKVAEQGVARFLIIYYSRIRTIYLIRYIWRNYTSQNRSSITENQFFSLFWPLVISDDLT